MPRWTISVVALALVMAVGSVGFAQTPGGSGDKMDKEKMMEKKGDDGKMMDKMEKDKMMDKKDSKMMDKDKMMDKKDDSKMMDKKQ
jgi:hypothetical protein